jgi:hypothetical protein
MSFDWLMFWFTFCVGVFAMVGMGALRAIRVAIKAGDTPVAVCLAVVAFLCWFMAPAVFYVACRN